MSRPLIVSDCDEVLLHMVAPFRDWLGETQGVTFKMDSADFSKAMRYAKDGELVPPEQIWSLLNKFFDTEMYRQQAIAGAVAGINAVGKDADVVILTNLNDHRRDMRARQLADVGINARVFTNQGPKGPALKAILDEYNPSRALFIDDLPQHHDSVSQLTPDVIRRTEQLAIAAEAYSVEGHAGEDVFSRFADEDGVSPVEFAESGELASLVQTALAKLAPNQAYALRRYYIEDATLEEIAGELGVSKERVRQIREAGEKKLRGDYHVLGLWQSIISHRRR